MNILLDFVPVVVFFVIYQYEGIITATKAIVIATVVTTAIQFQHSRRVNWGATITAAVLLIFATLTVYSGDTTFIKMKPTIVYSFFCAALLFGLLCNKLLLKALLHKADIKVTTKGWRQATILWAIFFLAAALTNEFVWRYCSESAWVTFKVFGMLPLTFLCSIINALIFYRHAETIQTE